MERILALNNYPYYLNKRSFFRKTLAKYERLFCF
ncbi:hypothetical protein HD_2034 [[Haemophilus] ducreyi 35000HP]|uniref:Uncharacterized protein n=1 Tax=Haemophilus ducreyi (strain 35000HP / ATCC 700724) TaxID=233412 RepID=Q7VK94_HAEDU|nr:hypothetical protein HD_2034 [[Haemophilus] ducreyi 35000HP]